jgi:hypothetical protein
MEQQAPFWSTCWRGTSLVVDDRSKVLDVPLATSKFRMSTAANRKSVFVTDAMICKGMTSQS